MSRQLSRMVKSNFRRSWNQLGQLAVRNQLLCSGYCVGYTVMVTYKVHKARSAHGQTWYQWSEPDELVTEGIYGELRHPLYVGFVSLLLGIAIGLKNKVHSTIVFTVCSLSISIIDFFITPKEEAELYLKFGERYKRYRQRVPKYYGFVDETVEIDEDLSVKPTEPWVLDMYQWEQAEDDENEDLLGPSHFVGSLERSQNIMDPNQRNLDEWSPFGTLKKVLPG